MKKNTISYQLNKVRGKSSAIVYFANLHIHSYSPFQFSARGDEVSEIMGDDHGPTIQFDPPQLVNLSVLLVPYPLLVHTTLGLARCTPTRASRHGTQIEV